MVQTMKGVNVISHAVKADSSGDSCLPPWTPINCTGALMTASVPIRLLMYSQEVVQHFLGEVAHYAT